MTNRLLGYILGCKANTNQRGFVMDKNLEVKVTTMVDDDGRWNDEQWIAEQAELSATMNAYENSQAVG